MDDDPASKMILVISLKKYGHTVLQASTGPEAIELFQNHPDIRLVLMDYKMPGMNGIETSTEIRRLNKDVVIILQTANPHLVTNDDVVKTGCNDLILKPINISEINMILQKHLNS